MNQHRFVIASLIGALAASTFAVAQPHHHGDIVVAVDPAAAGGSQLTTNTTEDDTGETLPECLFVAEMPPQLFTLEPGFDSAPGTFPTTAEIGFNIRRTLRAWNGSDFTTVPDEWLEITLGPLGPVSTPATDPPAPIPGLASGVTVDGEFHTHVRFTLRAPAGPGGEVLPPDPGLYLLELELWMDPPAHATSHAFWILFNHNDSPVALDEAVDWLRGNLVWCPDPHGHDHCDADRTGDELIDVFDLLAYLDAWFALDPAAELDGEPGVNVFDLLTYLDAWFAGC